MILLTSRNISSSNIASIGIEKKILGKSGLFRKLDSTFLISG